MKLINILYADEYDDVDIVCVPDFIHDNVQMVVQKFNDWLSSTRDHGYYKKSSNGHEVLSVGTEEFVKWLNDNYIQCENKKIIVVEAHTKHNPDYSTAEF